jgi:hypothetical protein
MSKNKEELMRFLENLDKDNIHFRAHFYEKREFDRKYLTEELIISALKDTNKLIGFQDQSKTNNEKYRIGIKLSNEYTLVIICELTDKDLYIKTAWKTSRKWQKATQK